METSGFWRGITEFNQEEFYACHDTLEALWMESAEPHKSFYQGVLQIAVACYHLTNHNWRGAVILLGEGTHKLRDYRPDYEGIDVEKLVIDSSELLQTLQQTPPEQVSQLLSKNGQFLGLNLPKIVRIEEN